MIENKEYIKKDLKVFLVDIATDNFDEEELKYRIMELENLANTYGWLVVLKKIQKRHFPDYKTYIWSWKLEEIKQEMKESWADILIFWNILKSHQIYNVNNILRDIWVKAWDRVDLILKIFERHAKTIEARLQIELAAIRHMWPRIVGMWMELSRQWWWSKLARWVWETNTEIMRRHLKDKQIKIRNKLEEYKKTRSLHRQARLQNNLDTVGIVGYTNAWKSRLLNSLTHKWVLSEDKLFATLWTSVWKMYVQVDEMNWKEILLNDTIWFIKDLPPGLIDAFSSTLEDSIQSKILLHVVDASDPKIEDKINVVDEILKNIEALQPKIYVFNKIDLIDDERKLWLAAMFKELNPIFVSAEKKLWLEDLKKRIITLL